MNYYERHIGDYIRDTVSLTMLEDGAYNRLLDQYYQTERPLSLDRKMVYRLARATSATERKAVDFVLETFFTRTEEGYKQKRVQAEIERFSEKQRKAKASAEARWSKSKGNANASESHDASDMRTHSEGNALQTPDTSNHKTSPHTPRGGKDQVEDKAAKPKRSAVGLPAFLQECRKAGEKPIPEGDAVFEYADKVGIPLEFLRLHWLEFKTRYSDPDAKRYKDWRAVYRKSVRGNWLKLWFFAPDGSVALTTVGEQARRSNGEAA